VYVNTSDASGVRINRIEVKGIYTLLDKKWSITLTPSSRLISVVLILAHLQRHSWHHDHDTRNPFTLTHEGKNKEDKENGDRTATTSLGKGSKTCIIVMNKQKEMPLEYLMQSQPFSASSLRHSLDSFILTCLPEFQTRIEVYSLLDHYYVFLFLLFSSFPYALHSCLWHKLIPFLVIILSFQSSSRQNLIKRRKFFPSNLQFNRTSQFEC